MELLKETAAKLDENIQRVLMEGVFDTGSPLPVIVRCAPNSVSEISKTITELGGRVRHELSLLGAVAAWIPMCLIPKIADRNEVIAVELEECFSLA